MSTTESPGSGRPRRAIGARLRALRMRVRAELSWDRIYRTTSYAKSALWIVPLVAIAIVLLIAPVTRWLDAWLEWKLTGLDVDGAQALYQTVITLTLSFLVFTFGSLLVAIQVSGGQLTPRIIATTLLRDNVVRYSVGLFVLALMLAVTALNRLQGHVNQFSVAMIGLLGLASLTTFLFLIDYCARLLRPVTILTRVGDMGLDVIGEVYPDPVAAGEEAAAAPRRGKPDGVVIHEGSSGVLLAINFPALLAEARASGGLIEVAPQVGDFVAFGEPLLRLYGGAASVPQRRLLAGIAFGPERTLEQDPLFAFRILADIGLKALSPAINDPTTGVLALDQLHRLLRIVGQRHLRGDTLHDENGVPRVLFRTPDWEDYVQLSCREIRACGANNLQIARRMMAMFDDLLRLLPAHRRRALEVERDLLDRTLLEVYKFPEDLALARIPDIQGLGSPVPRSEG